MKFSLEFFAHFYKLFFNFGQGETGIFYPVDLNNFVEYEVEP
jgi:hypothetical protein